MTEEEPDFIDKNIDNVVNLPVIREINVVSKCLRQLSVRKRRSKSQSR